MKIIQIRSVLIFFVLLFTITSCTNSKLASNQLTSSEAASYEDMLKMSDVNLNDIQSTFDAYAKTHEVSDMDLRWFNKRLKK